MHIQVTRCYKFETERGTWEKLEGNKEEWKGCKYRTGI